MSAPPVTLTAYTDAELAEFYNDCAPEAEEWRQLLEAECDRRDAADRAAEAARSRPSLRDAERPIGS